MLKIATWNVNSLRVRLPHVLSWLAVHQPDVLALQETKLPDSDFPVDAIIEAGYRVTFSGQRTYNGVAILSRLDADDIVVDFPDVIDQQRRLLAMTTSDVRVINVYVPNGESVGSEKYLYKLNWLKNLNIFLKAELRKFSNLIVLGDFNIAPHAMDVKEPEQWEGKVLFSEPERDALQALLDLGLVDVFRIMNPNMPAYSWWDYRMNAFRRNLGLRIDHILCSQALLPHCRSCVIDKAPRAAERPSDHAPVLAAFDIT